MSQFAFNLENNPGTIAWLEEEYAAMADGSLEQKEVGLRLKKLQDTRRFLPALQKMAGKRGRKRDDLARSQSPVRL
ncbi:hypothetical protein [Allobaculum sp. Allo2]|uniref:hypothetical protein n=1 Tax=Allobaculum sp. Allo2 TaxID=2853432 RepID=UPI001F614CC4|nr:hypothetical protein [Allobaculum sp. Allo2]UNT93480.1 hypothetical protein KWG61_01280 [Allobaculum sp. Allo2]